MIKFYRTRTFGDVIAVNHAITERLFLQDKKQTVVAHPAITSSRKPDRDWKERTETHVDWFTDHYIAYAMYKISARDAMALNGRVYALAYLYWNEDREVAA